MKTISAINNERGMVLIVALMFLTLLSVLGAAGIMTSTMDMKIACANRSAAKALHIAEAGLTRAEAELINDLDTYQDIANATFNATSGAIDLTGLLSSTSFYTVFNAISFGEGSYTIEFKNYEPDPITQPGVYDPTTVWARSIGTGPNSSTVTLERYLSAENLSPWNNAIFAGGGGAGQPLNGNIDIAGSIHVLGNGHIPTDIVVDSQTGQFYNRNNLMDATLANTIAGGTTTDLNAKFRIKTGRMQFGAASGFIGEAACPFKGIYVQDGTDVAPADGTNDDIINGSGKLHADEGATSAEAYDLGDLSIPMPTIDTVYLNANSLDLTGTTDVTGGPPNNDPNSATADGKPEKGLIAGALELTVEYKPGGATWYYPDIEQYDGASWAVSTNGIRFDSNTNVLEIKGIVKVTTLNISDDIKIDGKGTIYTTGTTNIDGDILPNGNGTYPTTNCLGVVSTLDMTLPSSSQKLLTGAYFTAGQAVSSKQNELAGTIVCQGFNITNQVPKIWQVPSLANNLPPGMPGAAAIWVFTDRT